RSPLATNRVAERVSPPKFASRCESASPPRYGRFAMIDFATAFPSSRKVYDARQARLTADGPDVTLQVPVREVALSGGEAPVRLYDTSGSQGGGVRGGLP